MFASDVCIYGEFQYHLWGILETISFFLFSSMNFSASYVTEKFCPKCIK